MPTDEIQKTIHSKLTIIRDILNSQYGVVGLLAAIFYIIGQLSPAEYDQATHFVTHTIDQLNNPVGVAIIIGFLLVFFNRTFFQTYLKRQVQYAEAVKDFEAALQNFASQCAHVQIDRRSEDVSMQEQIKTLHTILTNFYHDFKKHETFAVEVNNRVQMDLTPNIKRLLDYLDDKKGGE